MSLHTNKSKVTPLFLKDRKAAPVLQNVVGSGFMADIEKVDTFQLELTKYNGEVEHALSHARKVSIDTEDDATSNVEFAGEMRKLSKKIDATRKDITAPAREFVAKVNALAGGYTDKLDEAIGLISAKVGSYNRDKAERQLKEMEELAIIEAAAGVKTDFAVMPANANTKTATASTVQRSEWDIEIEDFSKIPVDFLMLNEALVKQAVKMGRDTIPGLKITERKVTGIRTK